jgi:hypothetical protein
MWEALKEQSELLAHLESENASLKLKHKVLEAAVQSRYED